MKEVIMVNNKHESWIESLDKFTYHTIKFYKSEIESETYTESRKKMGTIELGILDLLEWTNELSVKNVIELLKAPNSTITSAINRLESQKILRRDIHPTDRRTFIISLTPKGQEIIDYRQLEKKQLFNYLLSSLDNDEEREQLINLTQKLSKSLETANDDLLRRMHMDKLQQEFNAFGPWIVEIEKESEIPPQFKKAAATILEANFSFKIPRDIERRDLKAGMPLYNQVIGIYDTDLKIFTRTKSAFELEVVEYSKIQYIQIIRDLLYGELMILADDEEYSFHFNPVSYDIVEKVVTILRKNYYTKGNVIDLDQIVEHEHVETPIFRNLLAQELKTEAVKMIEYHPFIELERQKVSKLAYLKDMFGKPVLQDSLFLTNGKELIILSRVKEIKRERETDYGYKRTFIPLTYIQSVTVSDDAVIGNLKNLELHIGQSIFTIKLEKDRDISEFMKLLKRE